MKELYPLTAVIGALGLAIIFLLRSMILTITSDRHISAGRRHKIPATSVADELEHSFFWPV